MRALSITDGSCRVCVPALLKSWRNESAHSPYLPASYRLTTRANSAASFKRGSDAPAVPARAGLGAGAGGWAQSDGAHSSALNTSKLVQKRDALIRTPE